MFKKEIPSENDAYAYAIFLFKVFFFTSCSLNRTAGALRNIKKISRKRHSVNRPSEDFCQGLRNSFHWHKTPQINNP